jgi:phosphoenolpyruvate carboxykinase (ATP)
MSKIDLSKYGIENVGKIIYNPSYEELYQAEMDPSNEGFEKGVLSNLGAVNVKTGIFTGRSPKDKYIVKDATTENTIWWDGKINKPVSTEIWKSLKAILKNKCPIRRNFMWLMYFAVPIQIPA